MENKRINKKREVDRPIIRIKVIKTKMLTSQTLSELQMKTGMCIEALLRMDFQKKRRMTSRV